MTNELSFGQAEKALMAIAVELRQAQTVDSVWLEYPVYLSVKFCDATTPLEFTLGFAQYDENENPIGERLVVQAQTDDGIFINSAEFDFVPNEPKTIAWNFLECALGSTFFDDMENN